MNRVLISPKRPSETLFCPPQGFDFTPVLGATETISTATLGVEVYTGVDSSPVTLSGSYSINGPVVMQLFTGGQTGTIYNLRCSIITSLGQEILLVGLLYVGDDNP